MNNKSVISLIKAGKPNNLRTKHISMKYFSIVEYIKDGLINVEWMRTEDMVADRNKLPTKDFAAMSSVRIHSTLINPSLIYSTIEKYFIEMCLVLKLLGLPALIRYGL
jgi:hypothetical protein